MLSFIKKKYEKMHGIDQQKNIKNLNIEQRVMMIRDKTVTNDIGSGLEMFTPTQDVHDYDLNLSLIDDVVLMDSFDKDGNYQIDSRLEIHNYIENYNVIETSLYKIV